jgi:hypothetical protein
MWPFKKEKRYFLLSFFIFAINFCLLFAQNWQVFQKFRNYHPSDDNFFWFGFPQQVLMQGHSVSWQDGSVFLVLSSIYTQTMMYRCKHYHTPGVFGKQLTWTLQRLLSGSEKSNLAKL